MVYIFLASGFEESEALVPLDILRRCGIESQTVGIGGKSVTSSHGVTVVADITEEEIVLNDAVEAILLPGGVPGVYNLNASETVHRVLSFAQNGPTIVAAICAAPSILAACGMLEDSKATVYPDFVEKMKGRYVDCQLHFDGRKILSARACGCAFDFGLKLAEILRGSETAEICRKKLHYHKGC